MKDKLIKENEAAEQDAQPRQVRLPGFILDEDLGLGNIVKRVTSTLGIKPCGGCEQRAARLNQWLVFTGSRRN